MNQPKLKSPRLCRLLTYIVVIGFWMLPIVIVFQFPLHDLIRVVVIFASLIGLLVYLFKNIMILMMMDMMLAMLSCHRTARTCYHLPKIGLPKPFAGVFFAMALNASQLQLSQLLLRFDISLAIP